jgi:hypothetical protein
VQLGPKDGDGACVPGRAQLLGRAQPAEAGPGDGDVLGHELAGDSDRLLRLKSTSMRMRASPSVG